MQKKCQLSNDLKDLSTAFINNDQAALGFHNLTYGEVHTVVDSTNTRLRDLIESKIIQLAGGDSSNSLALIIADQQTAGRGRLAKPWISPAGDNIYASWGFCLPGSRSLEGLSLVVGLALVTTAQTFGLSYGAIKWPNDLVIPGGPNNYLKIGGILIETHRTPEYWGIILGVGVNLNMGFNKRDKQDQTDIDIDQPWSSIALEIGSLVKRVEFIRCLHERICLYFAKFHSYGWLAFKTDWQECDYFLGKIVQVCNHTGQIEFTGKALGVNHLGQLRVLDKDSNIQTVNSGEVRLSP